MSATAYCGLPTAYFSNSLPTFSYLRFLNKNHMSHPILDYVIKRNPNEPEFVQAVEEVILSIAPVIEKNTEYAD